MTASGRQSEGIGRLLTWLCGGALALNLVLVAGLLAVLLVHGAGYFWQKKLLLVETVDGERHLGEVTGEEPVPGPDGTLATSTGRRIRLKVGNRDITGRDFVWVDESRIARRSHPPDAWQLERTEWGNFYGYLEAVVRDGDPLISGRHAVAEALDSLLARKERERREVRRLERGPLADVNAALEALRLERRAAQRRGDDEALERIDRDIAPLEAEYRVLAGRLSALRETLEREQLVVETAQGIRHEFPVSHVVRAVPANRIGTGARIRIYASRLVEFLTGEPRESNTEGGIFPAIFGTVMMVFLMSFAVTPFGVVAAVYLREYATQGWLTRSIRIAVNNLAGVPSIVFGIFGLGFFVYLVGGTIDRLFYPEALPTPTFGTGGILWASLTLALLTVPVVIVATEEGLAAVPRIVREGSLALGATKFETTWKVVVPAAAPGILTGMILAMARAAGEVAPLMIVGMVKLAPALPVDGHFPFAHLERKFMHLGFHIYDVGFQSPNVEATKPLVFATALLLIAVVTAMNVVAIVVRNRLRRKYAGSAV
ncbi:MAG: phosphate ABC transporter permease PstA [Acidobacteriota bacterium]